jgi:hypothetical protein
MCLNHYDIEAVLVLSVPKRNTARATPGDDPTALSSYIPGGIELRDGWREPAGGPIVCNLWRRPMYAQARSAVIRQ